MFHPVPAQEKDEVEDKVKSIIAEQLGVELANVAPEASFTEDLGADSLDAVELIMAIEEAFDIEIPDEEAEEMTTPVRSSREPIAASREISNSRSRAIRCGREPRAES